MNFLSTRFKFLVCLGAFLVAFAPVFASAATRSELEQQKSQLQSQIKKNQEAAAQKKKEAEDLNKAISQINSDISATQSKINDAQNKITKLQNEITDAQNQINQKEKELKVEQENQDETIRVMYETVNKSTLEVLASSEDISDVVKYGDYLDGLENKIENTIVKINQLKKELEDKKADLENKKKDQEIYKAKEVSNKNVLNGQLTQKNSLLGATNTQVQQYLSDASGQQKEVAELQAKINKIISSSGGGDLISGYASWYYSQLDPRWSDYIIGSYATIGQYGCLLTSLTMIANYYGRYYNPVTAAQASNFASSGALISTPIVQDGKSQTINWGVVDNELDSGHPVVAGIALGVDMGNSYGVSHFVVIKSKIGEGKYEMLDPIGPGRGYNKSQVVAMRIIR